MCKMLEEMRNEAEARGEARGEAKGKVKGLLAAAKKMVADGLASIDQVAKTLNLTKAQQRTLRAML